MASNGTPLEPDDAAQAVRAFVIGVKRLKMLNLHCMCTLSPDAAVATLAAIQMALATGMMPDQNAALAHKVAMGIVAWFNEVDPSLTPVLVAGFNVAISPAAPKPEATTEPDGA